MPKKDINQLTKFLVDQATGEVVAPASQKNEAAVSLGRLGGAARAAKLSKEQQIESARKANQARWATKQGAADGKKIPKPLPKRGVIRPTEE